MTRYFAEDRCEHGNLVCNWNVGTCGFGIAAECQDPSHRCPGGRRRELTDIEIVEAEWDGHGRTYLPFSGSSAGRYLIAPVDPE